MTRARTARKRRDRSRRRPRKLIRGGEDDPRTRDAARRLAQNPRDAQALLILAEAAVRREDHETARQRYRQLLDLCAAEPDMDEVEVAMRHGIAAFKAGATDEALKSLLFAHGTRPYTFEPSFTLGCLESARGSHEKAAGYFNRAHQADPDSIPATRHLGESLFTLGHYHDCILLLRRVYEQQPADGALLFMLGQAFAETEKTDTAARIFSRLRADPAVGPRAALLSAQFQIEKRQYDTAIEDLEIGLRHQSADAATVLELKYRLGSAWLRKGDIAKALVPWRQIDEVSPGYRDVPDLLARYREISSNARLKAYMLSVTSEFVTLCRRLCVHVVPRSRTKILSVALRQSEYVDITTEIDARHMARHGALPVRARGRGDRRACPARHVCQDQGDQGGQGHLYRPGSFLPGREGLRGGTDPGPGGQASPAQAPGENPVVRGLTITRQRSSSRNGTVTSRTSLVYAPPPKLAADDRPPPSAVPFFPCRRAASATGEAGARIFQEPVQGRERAEGDHIVEPVRSRRGRAWSVVAFGKAEDDPAGLQEAILREERSRSVKETPGSAMASGIPGKPAPDPTSRTLPRGPAPRSPPTYVRHAERESSTCLMTSSSPSAFTKPNRGFHRASSSM